MRKGTTKISGKEDILAQLEAQRAKQAEQLKVEAQARQELEDMLLRIERHFKTRQHPSGCKVPARYQDLCRGKTQLVSRGFSWRLMIQLWPLSQADQAVVTSKSSSLPDWACVHWAVLGSPTSNLLTQAEQAARRKAEEELAKVTESEASLKSQLEAEVKKRSKEQKQLAAQREEVKGEKAALDQMRAEFENELQQARGEMQRAQDALQGAEDQVSVNQQVERSKMERDYQAQMATLSDELNRVRQELTSRTEVMGQEMERWRQTAEATSR
ncbi:FERM domain-containing protein 4B [Varicellaria rhodocarpa]|nr:FERM domain-containing protein 4B [Varicellaria rhodocarpa]